jgi:hypothetical protein
VHVESGYAQYEVPPGFDDDNSEPPPLQVAQQNQNNSAGVSIFEHNPFQQLGELNNTFQNSSSSYSLFSGISTDRRSPVCVTEAEATGATNASTSTASSVFGVHGAGASFGSGDPHSAFVAVSRLEHHREPGHSGGGDFEDSDL